MNNIALSDLTPVRLATGVEPQQKWPAISEDQQNQQQHQQQQYQQKNANSENTQRPKLIELSPTQGQQGTIVTVVVQALPPQMPAKLAFNSLMVDTKQLQAQDITSLVATVPSFQQTHSSRSNVPISICFLDKDMVTETWVVADFNYTLNDKMIKKSNNSNPSQSFQTANTAGPSTDTTNSYQPKDNNDFLNSTTTTTAPYQSFYSTTAAAVNNSPYGFGTQVSSYQSYNGNNNNNNINSNNNSYRQQQRYEYAQHGRSQQQHQQYNNGFNNSATLGLFPSAGTGDFTNLLTASLDQSAATAPNESDFPMSSEYNNQPLATSSDTATTSTAQSINNNSRPSQHQVNNNGSAVFGFKSATHTPNTSVANYHPYPGLVSRANLDIVGDLNSMTKSWAPEEWDHRRRLVQFWREQNGNKITTTFQPVPQGERASNSGNIVVSCIYWMERNDFFVTSVDCIYLLESLMDIRFSVEEKNRIRRNLEGFRPLTVSKCKAESTDFFKIIMGFPNPKPRNIEKDVKVFPWKSLPYALKKIVTKYTASSYNKVGNHSQKTQQQQQQSSDSNRPVMVDGYSAQPYSNEMDESAYYNQQSDSNLNDPSTSASTSNVTSTTTEITPNFDSTNITNTSTSSPNNNEKEKPENRTAD